MRLSLYVCLALCAIPLSVMAAPQLQSGDPLPALDLRDQRDKRSDIPKTTQRIIFAADNAAGQKVNAVLDGLEPGWLQQNKTIYLADIHRMPTIIASMFALPQLRDKPYSIVLGRGEADLVMFPRKKECVTLIPVSDERLGEVSFACSEAELKAILVR